MEILVEWDEGNESSLEGLSQMKNFVKAFKEEKVCPY